MSQLTLYVKNVVNLQLQLMRYGSERCAMAYMYLSFLKPKY